MIAMYDANGKQRRLRIGLSAAAIAGLIAGPAFALGAMSIGGAHGGFHGAPVRVASFGGPRPPIARPPFPGHGPGFHDHFHNHFHNHFHDGVWWGGWGWGWGGGYAGYPSADAQPVYAAEPAPPRVAEPPPCPELLTWSPKLGRATRHRLCDAS